MGGFENDGSKFSAYKRTASGNGTSCRRKKGLVSREQHASGSHLSIFSTLSNKTERAR